MSSFTYPKFAYRPAPEQTGSYRSVRPVVVVGAGPVGLTAAIDLGNRGISVVLLDDDDTVSQGSRAICWSKRTLEIFDRLGLADRMLDRGVNWHVGRVFRGDREVYRFDLQPETGHKMPAFINLQQYHVEQALISSVPENVDVRFRHRLVGITQEGATVGLTVETPDGPYSMEASYVIAADGAHSTTRGLMGLPFEGRMFDERFLIADVKMTADFPTERWFWFDPPFHKGGSVLLHRQADDVWRIDFQLGSDADPDQERAPENVVPRIQAMLGPDADFDLEWVSVYSFRCRRMQQFRHGRVLFAGDSAHQISPFGARGGNGGIQDADNLAWKLAAVIDGRAQPNLLDSYDAERLPASDENILNSTRSTDFITPKTPTSLAFREAVLDLAKDAPFARSFINSGRLSTPHHYRDSPLATPDRDGFVDGLRPGSPSPDAPITLPNGSNEWLLDRLGNDFVLLGFETEPLDLDIHQITIGRNGSLSDTHDAIVERYDMKPGTRYLIRPDQIIAARWRDPTPDDVRHAVNRALALSD